MKLILKLAKAMLIAIAAFIGLWLGWYYGAIFGYWLWPHSEWMGAAFSYLIGIPVGMLVALWLVSLGGKAFSRIKAKP